MTLCMTTSTPRYATCPTCGVHGKQRATHMLGMTTTQQLTRLLTPAEVAEILGLTEEGLRTQRYRGNGPVFVDLGRYVRYRAEDVTAWIESRLTGGAA